MDINQNLEQVNTFEGGMNIDTSDVLLQENQYKFAKNLRFTVQSTGNAGELQQIEKFSLRENDKQLDSDCTIIKTSQIRDVLIFITETLTPDEEYTWSIYKAKYNQTPKKIFGPCYDEIQKPLSVVTRYETDKDIKLYIADKKHQLMSINIEHDDYDSLGNPPSDIKYLTTYCDVKLLQAITNISESNGNLKPAVIQYTYRLYKDGGAATKYAPLTKPIFLLKDDGSGFLDGEYTNKAVDIDIQFNDELNGLNKIQIYRITYSSYGSDPEIYKIYDDTFNGQLAYTDTGINVELLSKSEFLKAELYDKIKPSVIESKGNYLFAGDIEDVQDEIDAQWKDINFTDGSYVQIQEFRNNKYNLDVHGNLKSSQDTYHPSLRPGEIYRYGIVLYDLYGRRSSVKFVKDVNVENKSIFEKINSSGDIKYEVAPVGIKVTVKNIPNCSGYEIVRCLRSEGESRVLYQGIIGCPVGKDSELSTPGILSRTRMYPFCDYVKTNQNIVIFACPECVYLPEETKNRMLTSTTKLESVVDYSIPVINQTDEIITDYSTGGIYYSKNEYVFVSNDKQNFYIDSSDDGVKWSRGCVLGIGKSIENTYLNQYRNVKVNFIRTSHWTKYYLDGQDRSGEILEPFFIDVNLTGGSGFRNSKYSVVNNSIQKQDGIDNAFGSKYVYTNSHGSQRIVTSSSYIYPAGKTTTAAYSSDILSYKVIDSYKPSDTFVTDKQYNPDQYTYGIGNYTYTNYVQENRAVLVNGNMMVKPDLEDWDLWCVRYAGGKAMLLNVETPIPTVETKDFDLQNINQVLDNLFNISVANIINKSYKGYGDPYTSIFYSFGNYNNYTNNGSVIIYDGDTYGNIFRYNHTHAIQQQDFKVQSAATIIYEVPIQSTIDLLKTSGHILPVANMYNDQGYMNSAYYLFQDYMGNIANVYNQDKDAYLYNAVYSQQMNLMSYIPVLYTNVYSNRFDTRIKCSEEKSNGETLDSWLNFSIKNTLDVDSRFGEITNLRLFKDSLIFWQKTAVGIASVNERTIIQDIDSTDILLGTGGILERFDYFTTVYGMNRNDSADTQSNTSLYWWDDNKKEILCYSGGREIIPMVSLKNIKYYVESKNNRESQPLLIYNNKHNEILIGIVDNNFIVYNEQIQRFTSVYDYDFTHVCYLNNGFVPTNDKYIYKSDFEVNEQFVEYMPAYLVYIVNKNSRLVKTFDNVILGLNVYEHTEKYPEFQSNMHMKQPTKTQLTNLSFVFTTAEQQAISDVKITNREYDYRFAIPRSSIYNQAKKQYQQPEYGQRMKGRYMISELTIPSGNNTLSLQYITTKFRISYI